MRFLGYLSLFVAGMILGFVILFFSSDFGKWSEHELHRSLVDVNKQQFVQEVGTPFWTYTSVSGNTKKEYLYYYRKDDSSYDIITVNFKNGDWCGFYDECH